MQSDVFFIKFASAMALPAIRTKERLMTPRLKSIFTALVIGASATMAQIPDSLPEIPALPDPLSMDNGQHVATLADWSQRRLQIIDKIQKYETGALPPLSPDSISADMRGDTLCVSVRNNGQTLTITAEITYPQGDGPFPAVIGIFTPSGSLPAEIFSSRGIAMIAFDFNDVMSHTQTRGSEPINRIFPDHTEIGAYCAWPWGISRLIDGLEIIGAASRIDTKHLAVTGCSFAGKMALFAGALDERIALTIAQEPGGGGIASWRVSETLGNVETLAKTNYSWFLESMRQFADDNVTRLPVDHHELGALIAPRALLVLGNTDYEWLADGSGYVSCVAAREVWDHFGIADCMGYVFGSNHPHCMLPEQEKPVVEAFVDRFLLGKDLSTDYTIAPMFTA